MINTWGKEEITKLNYEFRQDGIYDKKTSKKLKLKFLEYNQGLSMNFGFSRHNINIDFEKKMMEGCINKNMTNKDIEIVFELLEKYHIYQLNSGKYWKKLTYYSSSCFDGYEWSLYLVFERDKYLRIFNGNDYPDIFTHLAQEIIDLTGKDILNVNSIDEKDFKLYKKYGDEILNE